MARQFISALLCHIYKYIYTYIHTHTHTHTHKHIHTHKHLHTHIGKQYIHKTCCLNEVQTTCKEHTVYYRNMRKTVYVCTWHVLR